MRFIFITAAMIALTACKPKAGDKSTEHRGSGATCETRELVYVKSDAFTGWQSVGPWQPAPASTCDY